MVCPLYSKGFGSPPKADLQQATEATEAGEVTEPILSACGG